MTRQLAPVADRQPRLGIKAEPREAVGFALVQGGAVVTDAEAQPQPSGHNTEAQVDAAAAAEGAAARAKESLLNAAARARRAAPEETEAEKLLKEERDILHKITQKAALQSVKERAMVSAGDMLCTPPSIALYFLHLTLCVAPAIALMSFTPCRPQGAGMQITAAAQNSN